MKRLLVALLAVAGLLFVETATARIQQEQDQEKVVESRRGTCNRCHKPRKQCGCRAEVEVITTESSDPELRCQHMIPVEDCPLRKKVRTIHEHTTIACPPHSTLVQERE